MQFGLAASPGIKDKAIPTTIDWEQYLNPAIPGMLHLTPVTFMHIVGVIEIAAGILVLTTITS